MLMVDRYMKGCAASLIITGMKSQTTVRYHTICFRIPTIFRRIKS